jgi:competence protein ComEA
MLRKTTLGALALLALLATGNAFAQAAPAGKPAQQPVAPATKPATQLLDINTASRDQLIALKGVGPTYADAIIKGRPYKSKDQLLSKKVLPNNVYQKVKELIIAKQAN